MQRIVAKPLAPHLTHGSQESTVSKKGKLMAVPIKNDYTLRLLVGIALSVLLAAIVVFILNMSK